jgi:hypothetical protein
LAASTTYDVTSNLTLSAYDFYISTAGAPAFTNLDGSVLQRFSVTTNAQDGKLRFTMYAGSYFYANGAERRDSGASNGRFILRGPVIDADNNQPQSGAAVSACNQIVYSDRAGMWEYWPRRARSCVIALVPDQFSTPGQWAALTGAQSVAAQPDGSPRKLF